MKISEIEPNRDQPRKEFDSEALAELADSIAQHGVLQPLLLRPLLTGGYRIVAGRTPLAGRPHGGPHRGARGYPGDERRAKRCSLPSSRTCSGRT